MKPEPMIGEEDVARAINDARMLPHPDPPTDYIRDLAHAAISAHLAALERAGWKLTQIEPTHAMQMAGGDVVVDFDSGFSMPDSHAIAVWKAMWRAAPPPQNSDEVKP